MFSDSQIATSFQMSKTKCSYLINHGLAPFFKEELIKCINLSPYMVMSFDESMNRIIQDEQMDFNVRYWDNVKGQVITRYFDSKFLKRPNAQNLLDLILLSMESLQPQRLIQLSMDGPSTNWNVLSLLDEHRNAKEWPSIINIGSCGLHIVHGAFQTGVMPTKWEMAKIMKAIWQMFHDSPARRDVYYQTCEIEEFPLLRFCATRWIEDEDVSVRAIKIWPNIVKVTSYWEGLCKSKRPQNETLVKYYKDEFVPVFFKDIANQLKGYLEIFQTDNPMLPFLEEALETIFRTLMKMFIISDVLDTASTAYTLIKLDVSKRDILKPSDIIDLPTATKRLLKSKTLSEHNKPLFKKDCKSMLISMVQKLQERSPLKYLVVRCASSLSPIKMVREKDMCIIRFNNLVDKLYAGNWIVSNNADDAKREYDTFLKAAQHEHMDKFLMFDVKKERVDTFFANFLHENSKYKQLWNVCKIVFTLSHGQSAVERGFSINKELLVENLEKVSLTSQRMVYDHVISSGVKLTEFNVSKELVKSCKLAHARYTTALEASKNTLLEGVKSRKRKLKMEEIADLKEKRNAVELCIKSLSVDIEKYSIAAKKENDMALLTKANSFRATVRVKNDLLASLDTTIEKLVVESKDI